MTQRSSTAKKVIKGAVSRLEKDIGNYERSLERLRKRLAVTVDERAVEQEVVAKTRLKLAKEQLEKLENYLESAEMTLLNKVGNIATIRINDEVVKFTMVPPALHGIL